jgi:hypothetical protein
MSYGSRRMKADRSEEYRLVVTRRWTRSDNGVTSEHEEVMGPYASLSTVKGIRTNIQNRYGFDSNRVSFKIQKAQTAWEDVE